MHLTYKAKRSAWINGRLKCDKQHTVKSYKNEFKKKTIWHIRIHDTCQHCIMHNFSCRNNVMRYAHFDIILTNVNCMIRHTLLKWPRKWVFTITEPVKQKLAHRKLKRQTICMQLTYNNVGIKTTGTSNKEIPQYSWDSRKIHRKRKQIDEVVHHLPLSANFNNNLKRLNPSQ